jgi:hypothetical protein
MIATQHLRAPKIEDHRAPIDRIEPKELVGLRISIELVHNGLEAVALSLPNLKDERVANPLKQ